MRHSLPLFALLSLVSCSSVDDTAVSAISCGDFGNFRPVSDVLEQRCGTIDCHGTYARPFRLYGPYGQRRLEDASAVDAQVITEGFEEYFPGGAQGTTSAELEDNYRSVCGLEPELMTRVVTLQAAPEDLTLIRKARLTEKHKGGQIFNPGRDGDLCITSWLTLAGVPDGGVDKTACDAEVAHP
jgi:hypothetical protein